MKKSFSINNIKQITSSIDNHPLNHNYNDTDTDTNPSTNSHGENNFEDYHDDSMELDDDYDSDDLSYTSCLSSQSNSNYSVVFEKILLLCLLHLIKYLFLIIHLIMIVFFIQIPNHL